jgi:hypothetical protein
VGYSLFFLMLVVPTTYQPVKAVLLALTLFAILVSGEKIRYGLPIILISAYGAAFVLHGLFASNPGALRVSVVHVLWPLVFLVLASGIRTEQHLVHMFRVMVAAGIFIGTYGCLYILTETGRLPSWLLPVQLDLQTIFTLDRGVIEVTLTSLSTLLFLVPFLVAYVASWPRGRKPPVPMVWAYLALLVCGALVLLSGRRALLVALVATPVLVLAAIIMTRSRVRRLIVPSVIVLGVGLVVVNVFSLDIAANVASFQTGFDFNIASGSAGTRAAQFRGLLEGWSESPIFGAGAGAVAPGPIRSFEAPWAYELYFLALLFQAGIVGIFIYGGTVAYAALRVASNARRDAAMLGWTPPILVGLAGFLIGTATNPYLGKFDSLWVLFILMVLLNVSAARREASLSDKGANRETAADQVAEQA